MRNNRFDQFIIRIGRGIGLGQDVFGVKHIQALVFHRPHIEVGNRDDIEKVQIVFEAINLLIPLHRPFQAVHRVIATVFIAMFDKNAQRNIAPRHGLEAVLDTGQVPRHQRKKVTRLRERIFPHRVMPVAVKITAIDQIAVG